MLAASLGTFAVANVATWTRSQADQAAYQAGADLRFTPSSRAAAPERLASALATIPGVAAVMPADRLNVDAGRAVRGDALLAIDSEVAAAVTNPTPGIDGALQAGLFAQLAAGRPGPVGATVPDGAAALGLVLDAAFVTDFENGTPQPVDMSTFRGIRASVVVEDGLGRFHQLDTTTAAVLVGTNQRLVIALASGTPPAPLARPIRLRRIEFGVSAPTDIGMTGSIEIREIDATADASADPAASTAWSPIGLSSATPGWEAGVRFGSSASQPMNPTADPWHFDFKDGSPLPPVFGGFTSEILVGLTAMSPGAPIEAIAGSAFLDATGARVGERLTATLAGTTAPVLLVGSIASFPTLDPAKPFLIVDDRTLADARFVASGAIEPPTEWWLSTRDPAASASAIRAGVDPGAAIVNAADREAALLADPIPRGVIGVLGLGSWAALVFAAIGFIVSATVSTRERLGEFALLRALGLSGRQLSVWLALEHAVLLTFGVVAGLGLGAVLAWLVLPLATLTTNGGAVTPPPVVVIPAATLLPILAGAAGVLVATLVVMRRQLLGIRIGDVLRAADE
ncbi:MAG: ABC transporter permease [Chloroflexi bacterium]|nr:ABC transporter permease [Chloroflexota bacterium]